MEDKIIYEAMLDVLLKMADMAPKIDIATLPTGGAAPMDVIDNTTGTPMKVEKIIGSDGKEIARILPANATSNDLADTQNVENVEATSPRLNDLSPISK